MLYLADTAEMPIWTDERDAPTPFFIWGSYTELGPFKPTWNLNRSVPYAVRRDHTGRHTPKARWGQLRKWASNALRESGEFLVGAFAPIQRAV